MNLIKIAIERPVAVIAAVLMVVMFGLVALQTIPIQLAPDVNRPVITVTTQSLSRRRSIRVKPRMALVGMPFEVDRCGMPKYARKM